MQGCKEKATALRKEHCSLLTTRTGQRATGNVFCGRWDQDRTFWFKWEALCLEEGKQCIPAQVAYPIFETWWWEYQRSGWFGWQLGKEFWILKENARTFVCELNLNWGRVGQAAHKSFHLRLVKEKYLMFWNLQSCVPHSTEGHMRKGKKEHSWVVAVLYTGMGWNSWQPTYVLHTRASHPLHDSSVKQQCLISVTLFNILKLFIDGELW